MKMMWSWSKTQIWGIDYIPQAWRQKCGTHFAATEQKNKYEYFEIVNLDLINLETEVKQ